MARKRYTAEEIIGQLRTIEIELGKGLGVVEACRKLGIPQLPVNGLDIPIFPGTAGFNKQGARAQFI